MDDKVFLVCSATHYKHYERWATSNDFPVENIVNDGTTSNATSIGAAGECVRKTAPALLPHFQGLTPFPAALLPPLLLLPPLCLYRSLSLSLHHSIEMVLRTKDIKDKDVMVLSGDSFFYPTFDLKSVLSYYYQIQEKEGGGQ